MGFAAALTLFSGSQWPAWAQEGRTADPSFQEADRRGKAWFNCLNTNAKLLAGGKKPAQADAEAATLNCMTEENEVRKLLDQIKSDPRHNASSDPYGRIPTSMMIAEFRRRFIWEITYPLNPYQRPAAPRRNAN
ncbi:hypothetical protein ILT42_12215 [Microvirga sp. BT291]|nr:hypothetical protein [Microvirga pudoricolor]